jgi:hypothetical protein
MNTDHEFQWRSELRKLGGDVEPVRDLWPAIAADMTAWSPRRVRNLRIAAGFTAALALAVGAGLLARRASWLAPAATPPHIAAVVAPASQAMDAAPRPPLAWAMPADPTLAAAARDLDGASADLQRALEQHPNAVFLVGLLNRTNSQRMRVLRGTTYPG